MAKRRDEKRRVPNSPAADIDLSVNDEQVFAWLSAYYLHQDQLSWSRTQTMVAVEAGILSAAFILDGRSSTIPLMVGSGVIWLFWQLFNIDWEIRDQHADLIDTAMSRHGIRILDPSRPRRRGVHLGGSRIVKVLVWGIVLLNTSLAALFATKGSAAFLDW